MWELDCEEGWAPKNWCFWTVVLEKTLESPLDCKEIQPVHSEGGQPWDFFGRTDAKAETPVLWPPHVKSWLIGKNSDAGRDWGQEEKGTIEDEMAGWHHRLDGREFEWTPGVGDGQGGLACCDSWGRKESDTTERLNWTELNWTLLFVLAHLISLQVLLHKTALLPSLTSIFYHNFAIAPPWGFQVAQSMQDDTGDRLGPWVRKNAWRMQWSSNVLPWKISWRNLMNYSLWGCKESDMT